MTRVLLLFVFLFSFSIGLHAQTAPQTSNSAENLQSRIQRARALIAAHQLETAASELESIRAATQDFATRNIASVMLMSIYLEAGNYGRAEALLEEGFAARTVHNGDSMRTYFALAGQAINGSRTHLARYRSFGINTTDSNLPTEAATDLDRVRSFLERMIVQAKEISRERKAYDSFSLLEDVLGLRLSLARDAEDQVKWQTEYAGARELLASQTHVASLNGISNVPFSKTSVEQKQVAAADNSKSKKEDSPNLATDQPAPDNAGLLNGRATRRVVPIYPPVAKQAGASGLVRVHVIVDESGKVIEVSHIEGPMLLRRVAEDAARQWFFDASTAEGRPSRLSGYIDFNFTL